MQTARRVLAFCLLSFSAAIILVPLAAAQVVIATVPIGVFPGTVAVNPVTNKIYVADGAFNTVTVIDGASNNTTTVNVGNSPYAVAVNPSSNKIYVASTYDDTVTVIEGATNNTSTVSVGKYPYALAVNSVSNKVYVANELGNTVTVIDGATNNTTTVNVGQNPNALAVNPVSNKIYVVNEVDGTVTVIDGASNNTTMVAVGTGPDAVAVNSVTNKIYVANYYDSTVTVIDGATNNTTTVSVGNYPNNPIAVAVNSVTNQIYVVNYFTSIVTVIDGTTNNTTTITVGSEPFAVAVNSVTNKVYVTHQFGNTVTVIDGATNNIVPVTVGDYPSQVAVNATTNRIYVVNIGDDTVSVIGGGTTLQLLNVSPCRLVDTRRVNGGGGPIQGQTYQTFNLPQLAQSKGCADLTSAAAYSLNVTLVPQNGAPVGYLTIWPSSQFQPYVSTMNSDGRVKANAAIVAAGVSGEISVYVANTADVVLDIDGYFGPASQSTLAFYPLPPCRVADTRDASRPSGLGPPHLSGGVARDFPVLNASSCNIPSSAQAYSLNFTAVPYPALGYPLGYLEVWPTGQKPPSPVSTLNNLTGTIVANAAIVPAGTSGEITAYANNDTNLVIDINGYFAPAGQNGLSLYPVAPCRVLDTRKGNGAFSGELTVDVVDSVCAPPITAHAYVLNATVVPVGYLGYLTLWPDGESRPLVSTLNALDGAITSNMAIVPTNNGKIDAYATDLTQLILDISSYFAP